jgi:hypothetical protein
MNQPLSHSGIGRSCIWNLGSSSWQWCGQEIDEGLTREHRELGDDGC